MYHVPQKMSTKKKIELVVLILLIIWGILFIINYLRYTDAKKPILAIHLTHKYDDGVVEEYVSLGYVYRAYKRNSITKQEMVPFWVLMENPKALPDLPVIDTDYNVPENPRKYDNYKGLVYFFDRGDIIGTYKCLNSSMGCTKALSGYDSYNLTNKDPLTAFAEQPVLGTIHGKFAFIDDSIEQDKQYGENGYSRTIYLYRFLNADLDEDGKKPEVLAKYADVKMSEYIEDDEIGVGHNNKFIVRSMENKKWGIISISEAGTITTVLEFEYDSISYDADTDYYILCKDEFWTIYDLDAKKTVSATSADPIYNVWNNNNMTTYFKTGRDKTVGKDTYTEYEIYKLNGQEFLTTDGITQIIERDSFIVYLTLNDKKLHFMDYGKKEKYTVQLYFTEMKHDKYTNPAFAIQNENDNVMILKIFQGRDLTYDYETLTIFTTKWENNY